MKSTLLIVGTFCLSLLSACSSSPATGTTVASRDSIPSTIDRNAEIIDVDGSGLGTVVYNSARMSCERRVRTGTRIRRDICRADGFNGLFPSGGLNMGTAGEHQPGYGAGQNQ